MPLIQEIWVINDAGVIQFNLQLGGSPLQEKMLGGFIAALEMFSTNLGETDIKSIIFGPTRFSLGPLGMGGMIIAIRTETAIPEKKANKALRELREKLKTYLEHKAVVTPQNLQLKNIGFSLVFDEEINDIFFSMG